MIHLLAMTQDEALVAIRRQVGDGGGDGMGPYVWLAMVALALSAVLLIMRWQRGQRSHGAVLNDPGKLVKEVRREAGVSRGEMRQLKREAVMIEKKIGVRVRSPLVVVLCPSLKVKKAAAVG